MVIAILRILSVSVKLLFGRLKRLNHPISATEITEDTRQNEAFAVMAPNFISALKTYRPIVLPNSAC